MTEVSSSLAHRLSVAPMMDWTDRHCRYFHRLMTRRAMLYTEMVTAPAVVHGPKPRLLDYSGAEHPVALQLGGSDPVELAQAVKIAGPWAYDEVNLNCGCPSSRVQRGAFGACLMAEPARVAEGVKAMRDAVAIPVTVKHRIGLGRVEDYGFVRDFVGTVAEAGCTLFIVHARNAWLEGLSPKDNREVPPLRHDWAQRLKHDFPQLGIVVNGGLAELPDLAAQLAQLDGVMVGRAAYHQPWRLASWDAAFFGEPAPTTAASRDAVEAALVDYMAALPAGTPWTHVARHMLGLRDGQPGARRWRQIWSDHRLKAEPVRQVAAMARQACHDAEAGSTVPA